jgi:hypothetical protein
LHANAIDRLWYAINRIFLLLPSFTTEEVTDPAIDRTSLLLSSKHTDGVTDGAIESAHDRRTLLHIDGATDGAIKPSLYSAIDRTWIVLDRMEA